eukprot:TRINITY_DN3233_c0_g1_i1.p2 TRINITY_DN3233_c0_g1~~TRINITY_DN3233_c0_g1_i1.p2  ORF type:complete len:543 (-),score=104.45 TRINITY_DN3233_c0_g1_i1:379-2007(-)
MLMEEQGVQQSNDQTERTKSNCDNCSPNQHVVDIAMASNHDLTQQDLALFQSVQVQPIVTAPSNAGDDVFMHNDYSGESHGQQKADTHSVPQDLDMSAKQVADNVANSIPAPNYLQNPLLNCFLATPMQQSASGVPEQDKNKTSNDPNVATAVPQFPLFNLPTTQPQLLQNGIPQIPQQVYNQFLPQQLLLMQQQQQQQLMLQQQLQQQFSSSHQQGQESVFELCEGETYGVPVAPPSEGESNNNAAGGDDSAACYGQQQAAMIAYYQMWMCSLFGSYQMAAQPGSIWNGNLMGGGMNMQGINLQKLMAMQQQYQQQQQQQAAATAMATGVFGMGTTAGMLHVPFDQSVQEQQQQQQLFLQQSQQSLQQQVQQHQQHRKRPRTPASKKSDTHQERKQSGCGTSTSTTRKSKSEDKVCSNCGTRKTPFWRKDKVEGQPLCNACGLYFSKNDAPRPANLWKNTEENSDSKNDTNTNNNTNKTILQQGQVIQAIPTVLPLQGSGQMVTNGLNLQQLGLQQQSFQLPQQQQQQLQQQQQQSNQKKS